MQLTFLGKNTTGDHSPTLYTTDRDSYVIQGWRVHSSSTSVEIPEQLLEHLEEGTRPDAVLQPTGRGTFIVSGAEVTDPEALAQMSIPDYETCVEVGKAKEGRE